MANARDYTPDVFLKSPSSPLDELVGMASCWHRGWYVAKEAYKRFREALRRKEKLSLSSLEYRINSEHETFPNHLNLTKLRVAIEAAMECLEEFNQYYDDRLFNKHVMEEIRRQFMEKYMIIGVVGRHKAGKSTLLNGLLHAEILPTATKKETALPVLMVHNPQKHLGLCPMAKGHSSPCPGCPELVIEGVFEPSTPRTHLSGLKAVNARLKELNAETRTTPDKAPHKVTLHVNIPIMQDEEGKEIRVFVQDTPGFGATEHDEIKKMTALSMLSSSLLVYVISCKQLEDEKDAVTLKALCEMDPNIVKRNRLVIAATHLDQWRRSSSGDDEDDNHEEEGSENFVCPRKLYVDVDDVRHVVEDYFTKATGLHLDKGSGEVIVPLSLEHAIQARKAKLCPSDKNEKMVKLMVEMEYRDKYSMGGAKLPPDAEELEEYSQLPMLEEELRGLLANRNQIWISSITSAIKWHLATSEQIMTKMLEDEEDEYRLLKSQVEAKIRQRQGIQFLDSALSKGLRKYREPLEAAYDKDIQHCQPRLVEYMEEAFESFKEKCLRNCHAKDGEVYNGRRYTQDLDEFTKRMSEKLSGMLNNARFDALDREDKSMYVKANGMIKDLFSATDAYCSDDIEFLIECSIKVYEATEVSSVGDVISETPLVFVEVLKTSEVMKSDVSFWTNLQHYLMKLLGLKPDLQEEQLSEKMLLKKLDQANLTLAGIIQSHFPEVKNSVVSYYFDRYWNQIQKKVTDYHAKNDKRVEAKYAEVENMRQRQKIKEKLCVLLRVEKSHCRSLRKQLCELEHQDIQT